jgi:hypothetical protein
MLLYTRIATGFPVIQPGFLCFCSLLAGSGGPPRFWPDSGGIGKFLIVHNYFAFFRYFTNGECQPDTETQ